MVTWFLIKILCDWSMISGGQTLLIGARQKSSSFCLICSFFRGDTLLDFLSRLEYKCVGACTNHIFFRYLNFVYIF